jgi:hypothetical protein
MSVSIQVKVTVPEIIFQSDIIRLRIENAIRSKTIPDMKVQFGKTVQGWKHPPDFSQKLVSANDHISGIVWASGGNKNQYKLVNYGAPPHTILPRRKKMLRFIRGYRAATRPKMLSSRSPQRIGGYAVYEGVSHPGFEARQFDLAVAEEIAQRFASDMQAAIMGAVKK